MVSIEEKGKSPSLSFIPLFLINLNISFVQTKLKASQSIYSMYNENIMKISPEEQL